MYSIFYIFKHTSSEKYFEKYHGTEEDDWLEDAPKKLPKDDVKAPMEAMGSNSSPTAVKIAWSTIFLSVLVNFNIVHITGANLFLSLNSVEAINL